MRVWPEHRRAAHPINRTLDAHALAALRRRVDAQTAARRAERAVHLFARALLGEPAALDALLSDWLVHRTGERAPADRIGWLMRTLHAAEPTLEIVSDGTLRLFDAPALAIHFSALAPAAAAALAGIVTEWQLYFEHKTIWEGGRGQRLVEYRGCLHAEAVRAAVDPPRLCARMFVRLLHAAALAGDVVRMRLALEGVLDRFLSAAGETRLGRYAVVDAVLREGPLALLQGWDPRTAMLPPLRAMGDSN